MEEEFQGRATELQLQCYSARIMSPEIVEIGDESKTIISSRDGGATDVYVAVGKDDIDVLKWALDHAVSPGCCVFLLHVFPPLTYIPTPGTSRFLFSLFFHQKILPSCFSRIICLLRNQRLEINVSNRESINRFT